MQKAYEKSLGRTFLLKAVGHEAVLQDIVLGGGEALDGAVAAVVVGEDQSVRTHDDARAEITEIHHSILQAHALGVVQFAGREFQPQLLHGVGRLRVDAVQHPHTLVGTDDDASCHKEHEE